MSTGQCFLSRFSLSCPAPSAEAVRRTFGKGLTPPHYRLKMADVRANALAALATVPSLTGRHATRRSGPVSVASWGSSDTLTETVAMRRDRSRGGAVSEVLRSGGPRGRALREATEQILI